MEDNIKVDIDFIINNPELKAASEKARANIMGVGVTAESTAARAQAGIAALTKNSFKEIDNTVEKTEKSTNGLFKSIKLGLAAIGAYFTFDALINFGKQVLNITAEFQKLNAVLSNTLGSNGLANLVMKQIEEFAAKTPFSVKELTDSFVKLANQGFVPTGKEMIKLGDLASSTGKSFDQLSEAILDAMSGENERLKEFGIKAKVNGDQVTYTFKGVATTVDNTADSIRNYVTSLGELEGVTGSMAAISATLTGEISNLGDSWDQMLKSFGDGNTGVFSGAISFIKQLVDQVTDLNRGLNTTAKYNLKTDRRASGGMLDYILGNNDQADHIDDIGDGLSSSNAKFIDGAKYIREYNAEITRLAKYAKIELLGVEDKNLRNAITAKYNEAISQLKDKGRKIIADRADDKPAALSPKQLKSIDDARRKLESDNKQALNQQEAFEKQRASVKDKYISLSLDKESAAREAIIKDFKELESETKKQAAFYDAFVKKYGQRNANDLGLKRPDTGSITHDRDNALSDLTYRQETEALNKQIAKQKQVFEDFEEYKLNFGLKKAQEKYGKDLQGFESYTAFLKAELDKLPENATGLQAERRKNLSEELAKSQKNDEKLLTEHLIRVYQDTQTYDQKKLALENQYQIDLAFLQQKGSKGQLDILKANADQQLAQLEQERIEKLAFFDVLFGDIETTTKASLQEAIAAANAEIQKLGTDPKFAKQVAVLKKQIKSVGENIESRTPEGLRKVSAAFKDMADGARLFNEGLGQSLSTLSEMVGMAAKVGDGLSQAKAGFASGGDILSGISGVIGAVGAAASIVGTVFNAAKTLAFAKSDREAEQRQQENALSLEKTQRSVDALTGALDRQAKVADRAFGVDRISTYRNQIELAKGSIIKTIDEINKLEATDAARPHARPNRGGNEVPGVPNSNDSGGNTFLTPDLYTLNEVITRRSNPTGRPERSQRGDELQPGQLETIEGVIEANRGRIEGLFQQIASGKLVATTEEELKKQLALYEELEGRLDQYQTKIREVLTGTTAGSLVDGIAEALRNNASAEDYANNFKKLMQNAIMESLKLKALEAPLKKFYEQFAKDAESSGGLDGEEIKSLRASYDKIITDAKKEFDAMQKITGVDFKDPLAAKSKSNTAAGSIRESITEETGTIVAGRLGGMQIAIIEGNNIARSFVQTAMQQMGIMREQLLVQHKIETNTANTVTEVKNTANEVKNAVAELKGIRQDMSSPTNQRNAGGFGRV